MILEEFDPERKAVIDPGLVHKRIEGFPDTIVSVFEWRLFGRLVSLLNGVEIADYHDCDGVWPIYSVEYGGRTFAFVKARGGAPSCVGSFEDVLAYGGKRLILTGNCGVLDSGIEDCGIIIPTAAIRDEGTSYHYAPSSRTIEVNKKYRETFKDILREYGYGFTEGITWTTDGFYRETPLKVAARKKEGAVCVEMECASMQALCDHRGVEFFQYLYAGDIVGGGEWDPRSLSGQARLSDKEKIAILAFELALRIEEAGENG